MRVLDTWMEESSGVTATGLCGSRIKATKDQSDVVDFPPLGFCCACGYKTCFTAQ